MAKNDSLSPCRLIEPENLKDRSVAAADPLVLDSLVRDAGADGVTLTIQALDPNTYAIIDFCNNGGLYLTEEGLWESKALQVTPLAHKLPPHCIVTKPNPPYEVKQVVKGLIREFSHGLSI